MLMKMDPQQVVEARLRARYERLISDDIKKMTVLPRKRRIMNKINGRTLKRKGIRLTRARKLNWKAIFGAIIWPKRIAKIYADIVARMKMDGVYPGIGFSCQWGFPVISHRHHRHQTLKCRNSDVSFHGKHPSMGSIC